jgi:phosphatidylinositol glycan class W
VILLATPLQAFLLSSDRPGLLGANKEGLASVPGYLAVFMVGLSAGERVLRAAPRADGGEEDGQKRDEQAAADRAAKRRTELALELAGYAAMAWATLGACYALGIVTSRRFVSPLTVLYSDSQANLPYVLWTVAYNTSYLTGYLALELFLFASGEPACPPLLEAVNRNGLAVFLVANLLTGLINVAFQTMYASTSKAMLILAVYSAGVCAVAWLLRGVRIKL